MKIKNENRVYKGWIICPRDYRGMWTASNRASGWGCLQADTLQGMKDLITRTVNKGKNNV